MKDDLEKCFEFILELEKLKAVVRKTKPLGLERYENSAEHSWQICILAFILARFAAEKVNTEKVIKMLLIHDVGEIDAGDVFFFDEEERTKVVEKEVRAVKRIFGILPNEIEGELLEIWNEFENGETKEAKFARAIDRVMPILQNLYNNKQSWTENNITKEQILTKTSYINEASKILWQSISEKINVAFEKDNL